MKKFRDYQPNQIMLFPPCINDWLPADHPVHFISETVEQLDLSAIYNDYEELRGKPPYDPLMMVKVLVYAITKRIRSSRKIERALYEDVGMRVLSGNQQPDHWTISEFRRRHHIALGEIFVQTVRLADKAGLVKLNHVATDGTKIKANASKHSAMSYGYMEKEEKRLRKEAEQILKDMEKTDRAEDKKYGNRRGDELPEELATKEKRQAAIKKAKAELEERAREKAEKEQDKRRKEAKKKGKEYRPRKDISEVKPDAKDQYNFTDPESRIMLSSDKAFIQGYNAQATVDAETHIIVAADLSNQAADSPHFQDIHHQVEQNTGRRPKESSADAGYYSEDNVGFLKEKGIEAFIPPEKIKHSEWRTLKAPRGRIPQNATQEYLMRRKLRTKRGRQRYKLRQTSVEPVFGFIKEEHGLRQFLLRGQDKVRSLWLLDCAVHNILKMFRANVQFELGV
jgi:transposase